jgi:hypothetical protein
MVSTLASELASVLGSTPMESAILRAANDLTIMGITPIVLQSVDANNMIMFERNLALAPVSTYVLTLRYIARFGSPSIPLPIVTANMGSSSSQVTPTDQ